MDDDVARYSENHVSTSAKRKSCQHKSIQIYSSDEKYSVSIIIEGLRFVDFKVKRPVIPTVEKYKSV